MKLQNMTVLFIIIILPIILLLAYYISLQVDTLNMQAEYNSKLLEATKEAISSFEINTVEWNDSYSETADSKRRDVKASINTFVNSFATGIGVSGTTIDYIASYVPAIAYTMYDGFYIYSPSETKETLKNSNGVAIVMEENLTVDAPGNPKKITGAYKYEKEDNGKILYVVANGKTIDGYYDGQPFTLNPDNAKTTYAHMLKPFTYYSAIYKNDDTDVIINYTLDNYITLYGKVNGNYETKSGYLIKTDNINISKNKYDGIKLNGSSVGPETLEEYVWYQGIMDNKPQKYTYVYSSNNEKIYFDDNTNTPFKVNSNSERENLSELSDVTYKKLVLLGSDGNCVEYYQALTNSQDGTIKQGLWYLNGNENSSIRIDLKNDTSAINYCVESYVFSKWVYTNLSDITDSMITQNSEEEFKINTIGNNIFNKNENPENNQSFFVQHKREVIKRAILSNLNQAITSYSRNNNTRETYKLPVLSETDWDQVLTNVSIITFVQDLPIGLKKYNNYSIATSTNNKEYVDPNEIYLNKISNSGTADTYFHKPYCLELSVDTSDKLIGYRSIDYVEKSYMIGDQAKYYYRHQDIAHEACYYCLVQNSLFNEINSGSGKNEHKRAYQTALARERYIARGSANVVIAGVSTTPEAGQIDISYSPMSWTPGPVTVKITTTNPEYTLQYSTDGTKWYDYTKEFKIGTNILIQARLVDGSKELIRVSKKIIYIDGLDPKKPTISIESTANSIKVTATAEDETATPEYGISGIKECYFNIDNGKYVLATEVLNGVNEYTYTFSGLVEGKTYKIKAKVVDNAGNETESEELNVVTKTDNVLQGDIEFAYNPSDWTNNYVDVTINTSSGKDLNKIEYSNDEITWQDYTGSVRMNSNGYIYARFKGGQTVKGSVTNIDKVAPVIGVLKNAGTTPSSIKLSTNLTDNDSGLAYIEWYYKASNESNFKKITNDFDLSSTSPEPSGTGIKIKEVTTTLSGLTPEKVYTIYAIVYDVAGNSTRTANNLIVTTGAANWRNETTNMEYSTMKDAFDSATSGDTLTLLKSYTDISAPNLVNKSVTVNVGSLTLTKSASTITISSGGTLTLTGKGKIKTSNKINLITNKGTLNIGGDSTFSGTISNNGTGNAILTGGTLSKLFVKEGTIEADVNNAIYRDSYGIVEIGDKDNIAASDPKIKSKNANAVNSNSWTWYGGWLYGKTSPYYTGIPTLASGYTIKQNTTDKYSYLEKQHVHTGNSTTGGGCYGLKKKRMEYDNCGSATRQVACKGTFSHYKTETTGATIGYCQNPAHAFYGSQEIRIERYKCSTCKATCLDTYFARCGCKSTTGERKHNTVTERFCPGHEITYYERNCGYP